MSEVKFKNGDLVYCPAESEKVCKITSWNGTSSLSVLNNLITEAGMLCSDNNYHFKTPFVVYANQENHELLSKLYPNVSFEPPPKQKEPWEVIDAMLNAGHKYVLCEVRRSKDGQDSHKIDAIVGFYRFFVRASDYLWDEATPITSKGQKIIDFIDGKCVLENGEVVFEG